MRPYLIILKKKIVVRPNSTLQNRLVGWRLSPLIKTCLRYILFDGELLNTPSHVQD